MTTSAKRKSGQVPPGRAAKRGKLEVPSQSQSNDDMSDEEEQDSDDEDNSSSNKGLDELLNPSKKVFAESGVVDRVHVINFMCHQNLQMDLSQNVNFIHGQNGSGKSAILQALQVGLGEKNRRGGNNIDLIKNGEDQAIVRIVLRNEGPDAFEADEFGARIVVEVKLSRTPQNRCSKSVKIGGAKADAHSFKVARPIYKSMADLRRILDHFNIQVGNPTVVLNQDTSREFLQSNDNRKKYEFFLQATSLDKLEGCGRESRRELEEATRKLHTKESSTKEIRADTQRAKKNFDAAKQNQKQQEQIDLFTDCAGWKYVEGAEHKSDEFEQRVQLRTDRIEKKKGDVAKQQEQFDGLSEDMQKATRELQAADDDDETNQEIQIIHKRQKKEKALLKPLRNKKQQVADNIERYEDDVRSAETKIRRIQKQDDEKRGLDQKRQQQRQEQTQAHEDLARVRESLHQAQEEYETADDRQKESDLAEQIQECRQQQKRCHDSINTKNETIAKIESAMTDRVNRFGGSCVRSMLKLIQKNVKRFSVPPVGPLGRYVKLATADDQKWAKPIQAAMGSVLNGWLVNTGDDVKMLQKILEAVLKQDRNARGYKPQMYRMSKGEGRHPVPNNPYSVDRIYDKLVFGPDGGSNNDDDGTDESSVTWAHNCIVDQTNCERVALVQTSDEGREHFKALQARHGPQAAKQRSFPKSIFTLEDTKVSCQRQSTATTQIRAGNVSVFKDTDTQALPQLKEQVQEKKQELDLHQSKFAELNEDRKAIQDEVTKLHKRIPPLKRKRDTLQRQIRKLDKELGDNDDSDAAELIKQIREEEIAKADELIGEQREAGRKIDAAMAKQQQKVVDCDAEMAEVRRKRQELESSNKGLEKRLEKLQAQHHKMERKMAKTQKQVDHDIEKLKEDQASLKKAQKAHEQTLERQQEVSSDATCLESLDRDWRDATGEQLANKAASLKERMQQVEHRLGNIEDLREHYAQATLRQEAACKDINTLKTECTALGKSLQDRDRELKLFRKKISKQASGVFSWYLKKRGHTGRLIFDTENGELALECTPKGQQVADGQEGQGQDAGSLSGGERSFTTLAFILALGEAMETPFRALDEFDVFMDSVNRKISMKILVDIAIMQSNRQFIFITPQDITHIEELSKSHSAVRIIRMAPPKRLNR